MQAVLIGGRYLQEGAEGCPNNTCPDFAPDNFITIDSGETYHYEESFTPSQNGPYHFFPAVQTTDDIWLVNIPLQNGNPNTAELFVGKLTESSWEQYTFELDADNDGTTEEYYAGCATIGVGQLINYYLGKQYYQEGWLDRMLENVRVWPRFIIGGQPIVADFLHGGCSTEDGS